MAKTSLTTTQLGTTGLEITRVGIGAWAALAGVQDRPFVFTKASLLDGPDRRFVHSLKRDSILR